MCVYFLSQISVWISIVWADCIKLNDLPLLLGNLYGGIYVNISNYIFDKSKRILTFK